MATQRAKTTSLAKAKKKRVREPAEPFEVRAFGLTACKWSIDPEPDKKNRVKQRNYFATIYRYSDEENIYGSILLDVEVPKEDEHPQAELEATYAFYVKVHSADKTMEERDDYIRSVVGASVWQQFRNLLVSVSGQSFFALPPLPPIYPDIEIKEAAADGTPAE